MRVLEILSAPASCASFPFSSADRRRPLSVCSPVLSALTFLPVPRVAIAQVPSQDHVQIRAMLPWMVLMSTTRQEILRLLPLLTPLLILFKSLEQLRPARPRPQDAAAAERLN